MKTKSFRFGTALVLAVLVLAVAGAAVPAQAQIDPIEPKDDAINDALAVPANPQAPSGAIYTVLYNFLTGGPGPEWPGALGPQGRDGDLYGYSQYGGTNNTGSIWKTDPARNWIAVNAVQTIQLQQKIKTDDSNGTTL